MAENTVTFLSIYSLLGELLNFNKVLTYRGHNNFMDFNNAEYGIHSLLNNIQSINNKPNIGDFGLLFCFGEWERWNDGFRVQIAFPCVHGYKIQYRYRNDKGDNGTWAAWADL